MPKDLDVDGSLALVALPDLESLLYLLAFKQRKQGYKGIADNIGILLICLKDIIIKYGELYFIFSEVVLEVVVVVDFQ